jgi:hypothetical protein
MSFKVDIFFRGDPNRYQDTLRFATRDEAEKSGERASSEWKSLSLRWFVVERWQVSESSDDVNYRFVDGRDVRLSEVRA